MDTHRVAVYGTLNEAMEDGARQHGGRLMVDGWLVVTPASLARLDGMRVAEFRATPRAIEHRNWTRIEQTLRRSVLKTRA